MNTNMIEVKRSQLNQKVAEIVGYTAPFSSDLNEAWKLINYWAEVGDENEVNEENFAKQDVMITFCAGNDVWYLESAKAMCEGICACFIGASLNCEVVFAEE